LLKEERSWISWQNTAAGSLCGRGRAQEQESIAGDPREIEDRFYTELSFGTAGMRGVLGAGLNRMNAWNVRRRPRAGQNILSAPAARRAAWPSPMIPASFRRVRARDGAGAGGVRHPGNAV
jgi:hypothetical protein